MKGHLGHMHGVLRSGQSLAASGHPQAQHIVEQCQKLEGRWAALEQACEERAQCLRQAVTLQQVGDQEDGVCRAVDQLWERGIVGPSGREARDGSPGLRLADSPKCPEAMEGPR